jgi:hypothetical protein
MNATAMIAVRFLHCRSDRQLITLKRLRQTFYLPPPKIFGDDIGSPLPSFDPMFSDYDRIIIYSVVYHADSNQCDRRSETSLHVFQPATERIRLQSLAL